ncbi:hypothetical protein J5N97_016124 [Dioscorea zingiberensis]|uniref:MTTase N-terminal domain-containing protein n=1 Tax=Dioscorea zingiberensis TaxID=325984 RepID=A0A9D5CJM2_9LILI|nr:hypothetical protein J5N97_016124 [Dioscorea zingiberensis]
MASLAPLLNQPHAAIRVNLSLRRCGRLAFCSLLPPSPARSCLSSSPSRISTATPNLFFRCFSHSGLSPVSGSGSISKAGRLPSSPHQFVRQATTVAAEIEEDLVSTSEKTDKGRIYHETYGCQMNINDMEIVLSIMKNAGYMEIVTEPESAEIIFINTCAIRDNAEQKVWQRLNYFWFLKREWKSNVAAGRSQSKHPPKIVVLGCMAERLKDKILDADKMVDVVCGPDAYRDLPRLLEAVDYGQKGINTLLSLEETYADISPVRIA